MLRKLYFLWIPVIFPPSVCARPRFLLALVSAAPQGETFA